MPLRTPTLIYETYDRHTTANLPSSFPSSQGSQDYKSSRYKSSTCGNLISQDLGQTSKPSHLCQSLASSMMQMSQL